jgi:hypothetical protein
MKIGWGTGIALLYGAFVVMIGVLVYSSMRQDFDLVSKDYYQKELVFQDIIDAGKNQAGLSRPVDIMHTGNLITFSFPPEFAGAEIKGDITFYAPVNAAWDRSYPITGNGNVFSVPVGSMEQTLYKVKISWESGGKKYYQENELLNR